MFEVDADQLIGAAAEPLGRLANLNDATLADIETAREAMRQAHDAVAHTEELCDLIAAATLSDDEQLLGFPIVEWRNPDYRRSMGAALATAHQDLDGLHHLHFPITFPEVFLRARPGFDVILGNPPWQEATIEEHAF
jgi:hypothetical protein